MGTHILVNSRAIGSGLQSDWDIVERGWKAHVLGEAEHTFKDALEAVKTLKVRLKQS